MMELRQEDIAEIVRIFNESELVELRLELGGNRLYLSKQAGAAPRWEEAAPSAPAGATAPETPADPTTPPASAMPAAAPGSGAVPAPAPAAPAPAAADGLAELRSPLLGVFYRRPSPDKPPFVEIGSEVGADDPVCIIDVMKMFSRVPAGVAGRVVEILAQDGQLVEHGQVLMRLDPE
jgi:acetyl-CoA carboxylase biotin carboxyl carrier protein